jgi:phage shock protein E
MSASEAWRQVGNGAFLIDARSAEEFASGHFDEAINIPHTEISRNLATIGSNKDRVIVIHCKSGRRAGLAQAELTALGYTHVYNAGGYGDLVAARKADNERER